MHSQSRLPWLVGVLLVGGLGSPALALPHWAPRPSGPVAAYAPEVRHFIVVSPTPVVQAAVPLASVPLAQRPPSVSSIAAPLAPQPMIEPGAGLPPARHRRHVARKAAPAPLLWQQQVESVPEYPWGWFGARRHTANTGHRRFLGGEFDWSLRRGD